MSQGQILPAPQLKPGFKLVYHKRYNLLTARLKAIPEHQ